MLKKLFTFALVLTLSAGTANAQSFLKRLKDKAENVVKDKIENKVERKVGEAADNVLDGKGNTKNASKSVTMSEDINEGERPSLTMITDGKYDSEQSTQELAAYADYPAAIMALPTMPSSKSITSKKAKIEYDAKTFMPWYNAFSKMETAKMDDMVSNNMKLSQATEKEAAKTKMAVRQNERDVRRAEQAGLMPTQQEVMQAMQESGVDMDEISEQKMMDIMAGLCAKKWGLPKAECLKIMNMSTNNPKAIEEYIHKNHPDLYKRMMAVKPEGPSHSEGESPREQELNKISSALESAMQDLSQLNIDNPEVKFEKLRDQLIEEWGASPEAQQVDALERALAKRLGDWASSYKGADGEVAYPEWFTVERKKVNAIIDGWNQRHAESWLNSLNDVHNKMKQHFIAVTKLDAENEAINSNGTPDTLPYLNNRHLVFSVYAMMGNIIRTYVCALYFPCVERQPETGSTWFGKG